MDPKLEELYRRLAVAMAYDEMDEYEEIYRQIQAYEARAWVYPTQPGEVKNFNGIAA